MGIPYTNQKEKRHWNKLDQLSDELMDAHLSRDAFWDRSLEANVSIRVKTNKNIQEMNIGLCAELVKQMLLLHFRMLY